ncbi:TPA: LPXTG cell wall anchor domain-containing protein, partial [Streptococcus suis]
QGEVPSQPSQPPRGDEQPTEELKPSQPTTAPTVTNSSIQTEELEALLKQAEGLHPADLVQEDIEFLDKIREIATEVLASADQVLIDEVSGLLKEWLAQDKAKPVVNESPAGTEVLVTEVPDTAPTAAALPEGVLPELVTAKGASVTAAVLPAFDGGLVLNEALTHTLPEFDIASLDVSVGSRGLSSEPVSALATAPSLESGVATQEPLASKSATTTSATLPQTGEETEQGLLLAAGLVGLMAMASVRKRPE